MIGLVSKQPREQMTVIDRLAQCIKIIDKLTSANVENSEKVLDARQALAERIVELESK